VAAPPFELKRRACEIRSATSPLNGANLLFALVSRRYERGSIIITSNRGFEQWRRSSATHHPSLVHFRLWEVVQLSAALANDSGRASRPAPVAP
jgi:hypothetical protein